MKNKNTLNKHKQPSKQLKERGLLQHTGLPFQHLKMHSLFSQDDLRTYMARRRRSTTKEIKISSLEMKTNCFRKQILTLTILVFDLKPLEVSFSAIGQDLPNIMSTIYAQFNNIIQSYHENQGQLPVVLQISHVSCGEFKYYFPFFQTGHETTKPSIFSSAS